MEIHLMKSPVVVSKQCQHGKTQGGGMLKELSISASTTNVFPIDIKVQYVEF